MIRNIPNIITILRVLLIIPFQWSLFTGHYELAFALFLMAGISDRIDGMLARHFQWTSKFGAFLDPLADKLLLVSSFLALGYLGKIPLWLVVLVIIRDLVIISGALGFYYCFRYLHFAPTFVSKCNTLLQVVLVLVVLFELGHGAFPHWITHALMMTVMITTSISFVDYVWVWGHRAYHESKKQCNNSP